MQDLKVIAFTHKKTPLSELSRYFLHEENKIERLSVLKFALDLEEICYLATCNRIEFILATEQELNPSFLTRFFKTFRSDWTTEDVNYAISRCEAYEGEAALEHLFKVASSLDSMIVGEREIITQVRKSYDECHAAGLTGDLIRLVIKSTITTAKQVYTETHIATNPVSVVSLAFRRLRDLHIAPDARILMIGAGETNSSFCKYLVKYGYHNITVYNRTLQHAENWWSIFPVTLETSAPLP
jgi:glutamyl-tRNA reductase